MKLVKVFSVCLLLFGMINTASAVLIDDFTSTIYPDGYWTVDLGVNAGNPIDQVDSQTIVETGLADVLGGTRKTEVITNPTTDTRGYTSNAGVSPALFTSDLGTWAPGSAGAFSMSSSFGGRAEFNMCYDANGAGLNADLSGGSKIAMSFDPDHFGHIAETVIEMKLSDGVNEAMVSYSWDTYTLPPVSGFYELDFLFADFLADNADLDLTNIQSIKLHYLADHAHDVGIDYLMTDAANIPEPMTFVLLGAGGILFRSRKS